MAFIGDYFVYDGVPCTEYGLRLYEINGISPGDGSFSVPEISEDRVTNRYRPLYYGVRQNEPLTFELVFGLDKESALNGDFVDSWDREAISAWLSPLDGYKWLEIEQDDLEQVRYKCRAVALSMIEIENRPIAFSATFRCDSPFAYHYPTTYTYDCQGEENILFRNPSSYRGYYYPKMKITLNGSNTVKIINHSDNDHAFELSNMPQEYFLEVSVDNEHAIITNNMGFNLYEHSNFEFFRFVHGDNDIEIVGNCKLEFYCEFPVSVGG